MKPNRFPSCVHAQLAKFEREIATLTRQASQNATAITHARQRLTGSFQEDSEYRAMRVALDRLVEEQPAFENRLLTTKDLLSCCKHFLATLPDDTVLEPVKLENNGLSLDDVRQRIAEAEQEIKVLRAVPVPPPDIKNQVKEHVAALARPKLSIASGKLQVTWPDSAIAVQALLLPEQMIAALLQEVERQFNLPMPLDQRLQHIAELQTEIESLQWQARALGDLTLPPPFLLGVKVVRRERARASAA